MRTIKGCPLILIVRSASAVARIAMTRKKGTSFLLLVNNDFSKAVLAQVRRSAKKSARAPVERCKRRVVGLQADSPSCDVARTAPRAAARRNDTDTARVRVRRQRASIDSISVPPPTCARSTSSKSETSNAITKVSKIVDVSRDVCLARQPAIVDCLESVERLSCSVCVEFCRSSCLLPPASSFFLLFLLALLSANENLTATPRPRASKLAHRNDIFIRRRCEEYAKLLAAVNEQILALDETDAKSFAASQERKTLLGLNQTALDMFCTLIDERRDQNLRAPVVDAFLSHAGEQKHKYVEQMLAKRLQQQHVSTFVDRTDIHAVDDNAKRSIDGHLLACRSAVFVLSKEFVTKEWPLFELFFGLARQRREAQQLPPRRDFKFVPDMYNETASPEQWLDKAKRLALPWFESEFPASVEFHHERDLESHLIRVVDEVIRLLPALPPPIVLLAVDAATISHAATRQIGENHSSMSMKCAEAQIERRFLVNNNVSRARIC